MVPAPLFLEIMAGFPAGVVVVTAKDAGGRARGLTVTAFCPVSLEPPLLLICVDRGSNTLPAIRHSNAFTVNILAAGNQELARLMASKGDDKFAGLTWREASIPEAGPILEDHAAAHAVCRIEQEVEAGDHIVFIGRIVDGGVRDGTTPLVYHRRAFIDLG